MFGTYTLRALMVVAAVCLIAGFVGGRWTCHAPAPAPLTEPERTALEDSGHTRAEEGPVEDPTPDLPGTAVGQIGVTMRRRSPARGSGTVTARRPEGGGTPLEPGRSGMVPAAGDSNPPPSEGTVPAPIPAGLTADDLWGNADVSVRQAGPDLWTRAALTCCAGDTCRSEVGAETEATFDRAALCGRPRLPKAWTVGLGVAVPDTELALSVARWGQDRRTGFYGALRYSLDPAESDSVERISGETCYQPARFRTLTETADRLRVEAGVVLRF